MVDKKFQIMKMEKGKDLTTEQVSLIKDTIAKGASDNELSMFLYLAKNYELDPFLKEICFIKRRVWNSFKNGYDEVPSMLTTRDGFLSIAHRSGKFDGMESIITYDKDGNLEGAKATVHRKDMQHSIEVEVKFSEYCMYVTKGGKRVPAALWGTKPETMIKKVAESQVLRKAFNIHGIYAESEMDKEIEAGAGKDIEVAAHHLGVSESLNKDPEKKKEAEDLFLTEMLDYLEGDDLTVDDVVKWKRKYEPKLNLLGEEAKAYADLCIQNKVDSIVGDLAFPGDELREGIGKEDKSPTPKVSEGKNPSKKEDTKLKQPEIERMEVQERKDKEFLRTEVPIIMIQKDRVQLKEWKKKNEEYIKTMLQEYRETLEKYYKAQWVKHRGNDSIPYEWVYKEEL